MATPTDTLRLDKAVGSGAYSKVHSGTINGLSVATKHLLTPKDIYGHVTGIKSIRELDLTRLPRGHPHFVYLHDVVPASKFEAFPVKKGMRRDTIALLLQKAKGDYYELTHPPGQFEKLQPYALVLSAQLLLAVEYLHLHGIAHRDLKPENCLLSWGTDFPGNLTLHLADLGFAAPLPFPMRDRQVMTIQYAPPEWHLWCPLHEKNGIRIPSTDCNRCSLYDVYDTRIDLWALGSLIAYFFLGHDLIPIDKGVFQAKQSFSDAECRLASLRAIDSVFPLAGWSQLQQEIPPCPIPRSSLEKQMMSAANSPTWPQGVDPKQVIQVIQSLLQLDRDKRMPVSEVLKMPLFAPFEPALTEFRTKEAVPTFKLNPFNPPFGSQRTCVGNWLIAVFRQRKTLAWCSGQLLIHAIDLTDRVLCQQDWHRIKLPPKCPDNLDERLLLMYQTCVYMLHKFYEMQPYPLKSLWQEFTPTRMEAVERLEFELLSTVFSRELYRPTVWELAKYHDDSALAEMIRVLYRDAEQFVGWTTQQLANEVNRRWEAENGVIPPDEGSSTSTAPMRSPTASPPSIISEVKDPLPTANSIPVNKSDNGSDNGKEREREREREIDNFVPILIKQKLSISEIVKEEGPKETLQDIKDGLGSRGAGAVRKTPTALQVEQAVNTTNSHLPESGTGESAIPPVDGGVEQVHAKRHHSGRESGSRGESPAFELDEPSILERKESATDDVRVDIRPSPLTVSGTHPGNGHPPGAGPSR